MSLAQGYKHFLKSSIYPLKRRLKTTRIGRRIHRVDDRNIPANKGELRLFITARNEALRLPFLIDYYLSKGVDRIFLLDNGSTDETPNIVLSHDRTHLFRTDDLYAHQGYWIDHLLRKYGIGGWSLVIDADEVLVYPQSDSVSIKSLCSSLESDGYDALDTVLLDMYPPTSLGRFEYRPGEDPGIYANYFDSAPYDAVFEGVLDLSGDNILYKGPPRLGGGMRKRVFGVFPCISKIPLVRFNPSISLSAGTHWHVGARIAPMRGALLHYKYLNDFEDNVRSEVKRGAHWNNAEEYKGYLSVIERSDGLSFEGAHSVKYTGPEQLVALGIMRT